LVQFRTEAERQRAEKRVQVVERKRLKQAAAAAVAQRRIARQRVHGAPLKEFFEPLEHLS
jgi:hypothetical protein